MKKVLGLTTKMERHNFCDGTHPPHSLQEWLLIIFLSYSLLSYPFFVSPFFPHGLYTSGFLFLFLMNFVVLLISRRIRLSRKKIISDPWFVTLFASYGVYLFFLTIASLIHADWITAANLLLNYVRLFSAVMFFTLLSIGTYRWTMDRYTDLIFWCSVTGIALVVLVFMDILSPIGTVEIKGIANTTRDYYALGLGWGSLFDYRGFSIIRLQSFANEPGTFAFMLLLAIIWAFYKRRMLYVSVMIVALMLTLSIGAWVAGAALLMSYLLKIGSIKSLFATLIVVIGLFYIYQSNADLVDTMNSYLESKIGEEHSTTTSLDDRLDYLEKLTKLISSHPEGLGQNSKEIGFTSNVGWFAALSDAGVLGLVFYLVAGAVLVGKAFRSAFLGEGDVAILGIMVLVLAFAALQRARIDFSIWHFWILMGFFRIYIEHPARRRFFAWTR